MFLSATSAVYFVYVLILSITGTFGNICSLFAVVKLPILRKRNNLFMVSITCADLLVTVVIEPLILVQLYYETMPLNCKAFTYLLIYSIGNSTMMVVIITLQRYLKITQSSSLYDKVFGKYKVEFHLFMMWIGNISVLVRAPPANVFYRAI